MTIYTCPHHPEIEQDHPGTCAKCGMQLQRKEDLKQPAQKSWLQTYRPLLVIIGMILLVAILTSVEVGVWDERRFMTHFMAGFFLVFSGFKFLDLRGFAEGYSTYDLLAKRVPAYGLLYPFLELALGIGYLLIPEHPTLHIATLVLMLFSGLGVAIAMIKKQKFKCACLGTIIDVPLTNITLIEDFGMAAMAAGMLIFA